MHRRKITGLIMAMVFVVVTGVMFSDIRPADRAPVTVPEEPLSETQESEAPPGETTQVKICVYVCGEVIHPDVYELPAGSRANLAVEMAGGATEAADLSALNLAGVLSDGEKLYVPAAGEAPEGGMADADGRINLNTADASALMRLPGIGEVKAAAIIAYREANGPFSEVEDLLKVPGIKEATLSGMRDLVRVR